MTVRVDHPDDQVPNAILRDIDPLARQVPGPPSLSARRRHSIWVVPQTCHNEPVAGGSRGQTTAGPTPNPPMYV